MPALIAIWLLVSEEKRLRTVAQADGSRPNAPMYYVVSYVRMMIFYACLCYACMCFRGMPAGEIHTSVAGTAEAPTT
jgi:hypothetical protein